MRVSMRWNLDCCRSREGPIAKPSTPSSARAFNQGGAGTFGFGEISKFTHAVETLLDQMRNRHARGERRNVQVLLQAVRCDAGRWSRSPRAGTPGRPPRRTRSGRGSSKYSRPGRSRRGAHDHLRRRGVADPEPPAQAPAAAFAAGPLVQPAAPGGPAHWRIRSYRTRACSRPATTRCACSCSSNRSAG